jgi:predicted DNA-binding transcriptional regulator AlpA
MTTHPTRNTETVALTTRKPWLVAGLSRSGWYRLWSQGQVPAPVQVPGSRRNHWRIADITAWVAALKPVTRRRRAPGLQAGAEA